MPAQPCEHGVRAQLFQQRWTMRAAPAEEKWQVGLVQRKAERGAAADMEHGGVEAAGARCFGQRASDLKTNLTVKGHPMDCCQGLVRQLT